MLESRTRGARIALIGCGAALTLARTGLAMAAPPEAASAPEAESTAAVTAAVPEVGAAREASTTSSANQTTSESRADAATVETSQAGPETVAKPPLARRSPSRASRRRAAAPAESSDASAGQPGAATGPRFEVPRVDGPYLGWTLGPAAHVARVQNLDTPAPLVGPTVQLHTGQSVFPWMTIGVHIVYGVGFAGTQRLMHGGLLAELGFLPRPKTPLSIRAGFGVGFGAVRDSTIPNRRFGFGGAMFRGALRYEFFPGAAKRRPTRAGGFALGPELSWIGETPNQPNGPMNNTIMLGLHSAFYFGD